MTTVLKTLPPPQTTNHRQNHRRERPGARTRRTLSRKNEILYDCTEGLFDARDSSVFLPSDRSRPSPLLRQSFDQSWARWKAREAEAAAVAAAVKAQAHLREMDKLQQEQQRLRALFGGDELDDDVSLIPAMLNVMVRLFGDIDYPDP
ncbi:hypothetical protein F5884DRAFT_198992 [Xylogone sp. PMI_703]|nr:hypothetical protein F5884DRAFT_198992 [Xylogone sp. PMI_703]